MSIPKMPSLPDLSSKMPPSPNLLPAPKITTNQNNFANSHSITRLANSPTALKIKSFIYKTLSLVTKPFNANLSDYHKYRAKRVGDKIYLSSSFIQKQFGDNLDASGIKLEKKTSYQEFKTSHKSDSKAINSLRLRLISTEINNIKLNDIAAKIRNIELPKITVAKVLYSCKLIAMEFQLKL